MKSIKLKNKDNLLNEGKFEPDPDEVKKIKKIIKSFGKAYSSMRIFPSVNPSVKDFIDSFIAEMKEYLDEYGELKISVGEFNFSHKGKTIFQDEERKKSLPFLFFKDGIRELSFYKGLDEKELQDFLELIKADASLPQGDSDIVNSLWEKDFTHIRYFALDEFMESDIGKEEKEVCFKINREKFSRGAVNLTPEDTIAHYKRSVVSDLGDTPDEKPKEKGKRENKVNFHFPSQLEAIGKGEIHEIESMLSESRGTSRLAELINLLFEILFLEERYDRFSTTLNVLDQCYREIIYKSDFILVFFLLNRVQELKDKLSNKFEKKRESLEKILQMAKDEGSLARLKRLFLDGQIKDFDSFFQFLKFIGPSAIPLVGDIWEHSESPSLRLKALDFLQEISQKDIPALVHIATDNRVSLTKAVIGVLKRIGNEKVLPYLENFADHQDKRIRLEIISALRRIRAKAANKILIKYLSDEEPEIRMKAALSLEDFGDKATLNYVIQLANGKDFKKKNKIEKKAFLKFLAKTRNAEVYALLRSFLKKWSIFSRSMQNETRLCVVYALEVMDTPEAVKILKEGSRLRNRTIRKACKLSLSKIIKKENPIKL